MTTNTAAPTVEFAVARARDFLQTATDGSLYVFASDSRPSTNSTPAPIDGSVDVAVADPWQQMLFGRTVQGASLGIRNLPYSFGTAYAQFDDSVDMTSLQWYAVVNSGAWSHVFACLDNASGTDSSVEPDPTLAQASDTLSYRTSDGYLWMYLASTDSGTVANLGTSSIFPLQPNAAVSALAVEGSISVIRTALGGKRYDNYTTGTLQASDVRVDGVPTLYQLSKASNVDGYYTGCVLLITSGPGVGQYATILDYQSTAQGNFANLSVAFPVTPTNGSGFEVYPGVVVSSDGTQTGNVTARALVNAASSNSVWSVEVLDPGAGYTGPVTASVTANSVVGVTLTANVIPVAPPRGGHGYDSAVELSATTVLVGVTISNTEANTIPATNSYRQFGFVRDPLFANVHFTVTGTQGQFIAGEPIQVASLRFGASNAVVNSVSATVTGDTRLFVAGDPIFVMTTTGASFVSTVASVTNSSSLVLAANAAFSSNGVGLYLPSVASAGTVLDPTVPSASGVSGNVSVGMTVIGLDSGVSGVISAISRNGVTKGFGTFVQLRKYRVTTLGGSFVADESVIQGTIGGQGLVHSYDGTFLYVFDQSSPITATGGNLTGNTSGAVARVTEAFDPELIVRSGRIEYLENLASPISRGPAQGESFVVPFQF